MDLTYTWRINSLRKRNEPYLGPRDTGLVNVVVSANWTVTGTHANGSFAEYTNMTAFRPNEDNFTPYESLTEETIMNWIQSDLTEFSYEHIHECLIRDIDDTTPTITVKPDKFPWNS